MIALRVRTSDDSPGQHAKAHYEETEDPGYADHGSASPPGLVPLRTRSCSHPNRRSSHRRGSRNVPRAAIWTWKPRS